jgi:hypothetical protein
MLGSNSPDESTEFINPCLTSNPHRNSFGEDTLELQEIHHTMGTRESREGYLAILGFDVATITVASS